MLIYNALIKNGFDNFRLEILEYCERENLLVREQHYLDLMKPEYNILKIAGSSLGFKHSDKTLQFFKNERKLSDESKIKLSIAASKRVLTEAEKQKLSDRRKGIRLSEEIREKISKTITSQIGVSVIVRDLENNIESHYDSFTEAAKNLGVSRTAIKNCYDKGNLLKKRYQIKPK